MSDPSLMPATPSRPTPLQWALAAVFVFTSVTIGFDVAHRRGVAVAAVTQFVYAVVLLSGTLPPASDRFRDNRVLGGALCGPLAAVLLVDFTPLAVWLCVVLGVVAGVLGATIRVRIWRRRPIEDDQT